jgi:hypothetical protein
MATHLKGMFHKSFQSVCVSVCISLLSLQGNGSVKRILLFGARQRPVSTFQFQRVEATIEGLRLFLCSPCPIKGESVGLSVYPLVVAR